MFTVTDEARVKHAWEADFILAPPRGAKPGDELPFDSVRAIPAMAGGAEIFPDEGLDYILNTFPRATQTVPTTLYMGLFSSQTAATVPANTAVLATATGVTELTSAGGYARTSIVNTLWGAPTTSGAGRRTTATAAVTWADSTGAYSGTVNGFFIGTAAAAGIAMFYANFSDTTAITVNAAGYSIRVTPFWHYDG